MNGDKSSVLHEEKPSDILYTEEQLKIQHVQEDRDAALRDVDDLMHRCLLQDVYLILGDAALSLKEDRNLVCDGIDVGLEEKYVTPEVINTMRMYTKAEINDKGFIYETFPGIPVRVKFIKRRYPWFKYPEKKIYRVDEYQIPNPFHKYWKARFLVR